MGQEQRIVNPMPAESAATSAIPRARRGGGQPANTNRATHGLYAVGLPKSAQRVARRINAFRRSLCAAVEERGPIDLYAAAQIDTACHWLRHGLLAARWLRLEHDKLSAADRLAFSREVARAAAERDKAIERLRLDKPPDPWAMLKTPAVAAAQAAQPAIIAHSGPNVEHGPFDALAGRVGVQAADAAGQELRVPLSFS